MGIFDNVVPKQRELTIDEKRILEEAEKSTKVIDMDNPPLTKKQLSEFKPLYSKRTFVKQN